MMSTSKQQSPAGPPILAICLLVLGIVCLPAGTLWPRYFPAHWVWNDADAVELQKVGGEFHSAAMKSAVSKQARPAAAADLEKQREFYSARYAEHQVRKATAEWWVNRPGFYLQVFGGICALLGVALYYKQAGNTS